MTQPIIARSFTSGELSPSLSARADLGQYASGLKTCRNFIVQKQGGVAKRPGTRYVATVKDVSVTPRLLRFVFEGADQTYLLEFGEEYIRFYYHGAPVVVTGVSAWSAVTAYVVGDLVVDAGVNYYCILANTNQQPPNSTYWYALTDDIYEIPTPYQAADLPELVSAQSADVLTIVHPSYAPRELQRLGATNWVLTTFVTAPSLSAPTGGSGSAGAAGSLTLRYQITAFKSETYEESYASSTVTIASCAKPTEALPNTISWSPVTGAAEYGVYLDPTNNGVFGFIGVATSTTFKDAGFQPDYSSTPPVPRVLFNATDGYPGTVAYYQQRLWFSRLNNDPEVVYGSRVGAYHNFAISTPLQDDDAVTFALAGNELNPVAHLVGLKKFVVLSDAGEFVIRGDDSGTIRPTAITPDQESYVGAKPDSRPLVIGTTLIYVQNRGTVLRSFVFDQQAQTYAGKDLTLLSSHLFDGYQLTDIAFQFVPHTVVWALRDDGTLLGLTYVPDEDLIGWHRHDTGELGNLEDQFEAIQVLPDTAHGEDVLYAVVKREIRGATPTTQRYIERLATAFVPDITDVEDAFYVDSGLTYDGAPATTFTGLDHLEGECVAILADGVVVSDGDRTNLATLAAYTVTGGSVTIPDAASVVQIGLPIPLPQLETLAIDVDGTEVRGKRKRVQAVTALVRGSDATFSAGPDETHLITYRPEPWQTAADFVDGPLELNLTAHFDGNGHTILRHVRPLPFNLLGLIPEVGVGG